MLQPELPHTAAVITPINQDNTGKYFFQNFGQETLLVAHFNRKQRCELHDALRR